MITSWSPSRFAKYEACPRRAKYEIVDQLCPACFKGRVRGGYDSPAICDTCGMTIVQAKPLVRGNRLDASLSAYVTGKAKQLDPEIRHQKVVETATFLRKEHKRDDARVKIQLDIALGKDWKPIDKYKAWFRAKLDVLHFVNKIANIIDWKSGGIDKKTGAVRADSKYEDQLNLYGVAVLSAYPMMQETHASLVFVDCGPRFDPIIRRESGSLHRDELPGHQKKWEKKIKALLSDEVFAPRPSHACSYCPFSKPRNGGPCPH